MAKPSFQFFLNQASRRKNPINRLGMIYAGKQIALHLAAKYKLDPRQVLIRLSFTMF